MSSQISGLSAVHSHKDAVIVDKNLISIQIEMLLT